MIKVQETFRIRVIREFVPYIIILVFILLKIRDLFLPYFWDEAWSYIPAIKAMLSHGPSLMPNSINPELYRGHPLLFYFLSSLWMKFLGSEIWVTKLFPFLLSIILLLEVFYFTRKYFDFLTAILATLILSIQSVFFAQSTFLLPEILLTLLTILTLQSYLSKKYLQTIVWLTLALCTKESALIIWITIFFFEFTEVLKLKDKNFINNINGLLYLLIPLFIIAIFFITQKILVGWFFFPEHIAYISLNAFINNIKGYTSNLFIFMGRNILTLLGTIALIILLIKKDKDLKANKRILLIFSFFILLYLIFSSFNFYSPRYLLSVFPLTILIFVYFINLVTKKYNVIIKIIVFTLIITNSLYFTINKRGGHDHTLGYRDLIYVQQEIIKYCEDHKLNNKIIYTHFLMLYNLANADLGYLENNMVFNNLNSNLIPETEYAIISSNELNKNEYEYIKQDGILIKRYERKGCWTELYQLIKTK